MEPQNLTSESQQPPSLKWVFYVLGGASILVTLVVVFIFLIIWMPMKSYVSPAPFQLEHQISTEQEIHATQKKISDFSQSAASDTLKLDTKDVNNLILNNSVLKQYDVKYKIELQDSLFNLRCVVPVSKIKNHMASIVKFIKLEGFINAEMEGFFLLKGKKLSLITTRSQMNSRPAPFTLLGSKSKIELNQFFPNPLVYQHFVETLHSIKIENSQLVIIRKS